METHSLARRMITAGFVGILAAAFGLPEAIPVQRSAHAQAVTIVIENFLYVPASVSVPAGTSVTWVNRDVAPHTATGLNGGWDSGLFGQGQSFTFTPQQPGSYAYYCVVHPTMRATLTVTGSAPTPEPTVAPPAATVPPPATAPPSQPTPAQATPAPAAPATAAATETVTPTPTASPSPSASATASPTRTPSPSPTARATATIAPQSEDDGGGTNTGAVLLGIAGAVIILGGGAAILWRIRRRAP